MGFVGTNSKGSLAMQNSKSSGSGGGGHGHHGRLNPRKIWSRSRSKSQPRTSSGRNSFGSWESMGNGVWSTSCGLQVMLSDTTLFSLTEVEVNALRQLALAKLQAMDLNCNICIPKTQDNLGEEKRKRRAIGLKKRALTTGFFENSGKSKGDTETRDTSQSPGMVFGVPLAQCIKNDRANRRSTCTNPLRDVGNLMDSRLISGSASAEDITNERLLSTSQRSFCGSQSSCNIPLNAPGDGRFFGNDNEESFESLKLGGKSYSMSGLCFIESFSDWPNSSEGEELSPHIPHIVNTCFNHLETNGLHRLGLFRISSSKRRIKQLREDFDSGKEVDLSRDFCPHDVATLLKEYFRDLPEPLLTRELYAAFINSQRIRNRRQQLDCLSHLIQLLPVASRDTLWALLKFLWKVASNAMDHREETGEWVTGNKMDSHNLATLFGPNILHMAKPNLFQGSEFQVESSKRADERIEVIKVVRTMIDNYKELFEVSAFLLDELYRRIHLQNPEVLPRLLLPKLSPTDHDTYKIEINLDTGSGACSETTSVSQLPIDVNMEIGSQGTEMCSSGGQRNRTVLYSGSLPDHEVYLEKHLERGSSSESIASAKRPERGGSLGRDIYNKAEMVTSRLFRRRGKSSTRDEEHRGSTDRYDDGSHQWFRKNGEKKKKGDKHHVHKRDPSESEGSGSSDYKSAAVRKGSETTIDGNKISHTRPLTMPDSSSLVKFHPAPTVTNPNSSVTQLMAVVDIRKEHLNVPEVLEKRHTEPFDSGNHPVISASLTLKVPLSRSKTGPAIAAFGQGIDIPFIEDEQRDLQSLNLHRSSIDKHSKPSHLLQEGEKQLSRQPAVYGPSSSSSSQQMRPRNRFTSSDRLKPLATSASTSAIQGIKMSKNVETHHQPVGPSASHPRQQPSQSYQNQTVSGRDANFPQVYQRQRSRTRGSGEKSGSGVDPSSAVNAQWPHETWKRWEIISSEHTEQETLV